MLTEAGHSEEIDNSPVVQPQLALRQSFTLVVSGERDAKVV